MTKRERKKAREFTAEMFALCRRYIESGDLDMITVANIMDGGLHALQQTIIADAIADKMMAEHLKAAGRLT